MRRTAGYAAAAVAIFFLAGCYSEHPEENRYFPTVYAAEHQSKAAALLRTAKLEEALAEAELAVKDDPGFAAAAITRATALLRLQHLAEARDALDALCRQWPAMADAQALRGIACEKLDDTDESHAAYAAAVDAFDRQLKADGRNPRLQLARAIAVYLRDGRSQGLMEINRVLTDYSNYAPAAEVKQLVLDNHRSFVIDWMTRQTD